MHTLRTLLLALFVFAALPSDAGLLNIAGSRHVAEAPPGGGGDGCNDPQTVLEVAACALDPGEDAAGPSVSDLNTADTLQTIQWGNQFYYDHDNGVAVLVGKDASAGGGDGARSNNIYDAATDNWDAARFHIDGVETGHLYESFGYDSVGRTTYLGRWGEEFLQTWTYGSPLDSGWGTTSTFAGHWMPDSTPQAVPNCWFGDLFGTGDGGLVIVRNVNQSTDMELLAWRESTDTFHSISGTQHDTTTAPQAGTCEYIRSGNYVIAGATHGFFYRLSAGSGGSLGTATQIADPPVDLRTGGSSTADIGVLIDDPLGVGSAYILEKGAATNRVWRYDEGNDEWDELAGVSHPFPDGVPLNAGEWYVAAVYPMGVFWSIDQDGNTLLWRPDDQ